MAETGHLRPVDVAQTKTLISPLPTSTSFDDPFSKLEAETMRFPPSPSTQSDDSSVIEDTIVCAPFLLSPAKGTKDDTEDQDCRQDTTATRSISFDEVFQDGKAEVKQAIIQFPQHDGQWFILRCDEHDHDFMYPPLRGAAAHLRSKKHGWLWNPSTEVIVEHFGIVVMDCSAELAEKNNSVASGAGQGSLKRSVANAGQQTSKRPKSTTQKSSPARVERSSRTRQSKQRIHDGIASPIPGRIYLAYWEVTREWLPALLLPHLGLEEFGVPGTLESLGLMDHVPECYDYDPETKDLKWRTGYEHGGPRVMEREFAVMYFDGKKFPDGSPADWVRARDLQELNVAAASSHLVPNLELVKKYLRRRMEADGSESSTDVSDAEPDIEMASPPSVVGNDNPVLSVSDGVVSEELPIEPILQEREVSLSPSVIPETPRPEHPDLSCYEIVPEPEQGTLLDTEPTTACQVDSPMADSLGVNCPSTIQDEATSEVDPLSCSVQTTSPTTPAIPISAVSNKSVEAPAELVSKEAEASPSPSVLQLDPPREQGHQTCHESTPVSELGGVLAASSDTSPMTCHLEQSSRSTMQDEATSETDPLSCSMEEPAEEASFSPRAHSPFLSPDPPQKHHPETYLESAPKPELESILNAQQTTSPNIGSPIAKQEGNSRSTQDEAMDETEAVSYSARTTSPCVDLNRSREEPEAEVSKKTEASSPSVQLEVLLQDPPEQRDESSRGSTPRPETRDVLDAQKTTEPDTGLVSNSPTTQDNTGSEMEAVSYPERTTTPPAVISVDAQSVEEPVAEAVSNETRAAGSPSLQPEILPPGPILQRGHQDSRESAPNPEPGSSNAEQTTDSGIGSVAGRSTIQYRATSETEGSVRTSPAMSVPVDSNQPREEPAAESFQQIWTTHFLQDPQPSRRKSAPESELGAAPDAEQAISINARMPDREIISISSSDGEMSDDGQPTTAFRLPSIHHMIEMANHAPTTNNYKATTQYHNPPPSPVHIHQGQVKRALSNHMSAGLLSLKTKSIDLKFPKSIPGVEVSPQLPPIPSPTAAWRSLTRHAPNSPASTYHPPASQIPSNSTPDTIPPKTSQPGGSFRIVRPKPHIPASVQPTRPKVAIPRADDRTATLSLSTVSEKTFRALTWRIPDKAPSTSRPQVREPRIPPQEAPAGRPKDREPRTPQEAPTGISKPRKPRIPQETSTTSLKPQEPRIPQEAPSGTPKPREPRTPQEAQTSGPEPRESRIPSEFRSPQVGGGGFVPVNRVSSEPTRQTQAPKQHTCQTPTARAPSANMAVKRSHQGKLYNSDSGTLYLIREQPLVRPPVNPRAKPPAPPGKLAIPPARPPAPPVRPPVPLTKPKPPAAPVKPPAPPVSPVNRQVASVNPSATSTNPSAPPAKPQSPPAIPPAPLAKPSAPLVGPPAPQALPPTPPVKPPAPPAPPSIPAAPPTNPPPPPPKPSAAPPIGYATRGYLYVEPEDPRFGRLPHEVPPYFLDRLRTLAGSKDQYPLVSHFLKQGRYVCPWCRKRYEHAVRFTDHLVLTHIRSPNPQGPAVSQAEPGSVDGGVIDLTSEW